MDMKIMIGGRSQGWGIELDSRHISLYVARIYHIVGFHREYLTSRGRPFWWNRIELNVCQVAGFDEYSVVSSVKLRQLTLKPKIDRRNVVTRHDSFVNCKDFFPALDLIGRQLYQTLNSWEMSKPRQKYLGWFENFRSIKRFPVIV